MLNRSLSFQRQNRPVRWRRHAAFPSPSLHRRRSLGSLFGRSAASSLLRLIWWQRPPRGKWSGEQSTVPRRPGENLVVHAPRRALGRPQRPESATSSEAARRPPTCSEAAQRVGPLRQLWGYLVRGGGLANSPFPKCRGDLSQMVLSIVLILEAAADLAIPLRSSSDWSFF
jgi:hypothetical protein